MPEEEKIRCPQCGSENFVELEQIHGQTPCEFIRGKDGIEIASTGQTAFIKDMATSITMAYKCANPECPFAFEPADIYQAFDQENRVENQKEPVEGARYHITEAEGKGKQGLCIHAHESGFGHRYGDIQLDHEVDEAGRAVIITVRAACLERLDD